MNMAINRRNPADAYGNHGLEYQVDTANPHQLICMLYDGALKSLIVAKVAMTDKAIATKGAAISKTISIIEEGLRACLDKSAGGELAQNLDDLYEYMSSRLLHANLHNDLAAIDDVYELLLQLKSAWEQIDSKPMQVPTAPDTEPSGSTPPRTPSSYGRV